MEDSQKERELSLEDLGTATFNPIELSNPIIHIHFSSVIEKLSPLQRLDLNLYQERILRRLAQCFFASQKRQTGSHENFDKLLYKCNEYLGFKSKEVDMALLKLSLRVESLEMELKSRQLSELCREKEQHLYALQKKLKNSKEEEKLVSEVVKHSTVFNSRSFWTFFYLPFLFSVVMVHWMVQEMCQTKQTFAIT